MTLHNRHNSHSKRCAILLLILFLLVFQVYSIKFGRKSTNTKPNPNPQNNPSPVQTLNKLESPIPNPAQKHDKDEVIPQKQSPTPVQSKPQVNILPINSVLNTQSQKTQTNPSSDKSIDSLFGKSQSSQTKKPSASEIKPTPQQKKLETTSVPEQFATTPTNTQSQQKIVTKNHMISSLFGMQKEEKPHKAQISQKEQQSTTVITPPQLPQESVQIIESKSQDLASQKQPQQSQEVKIVDSLKNSEEKQQNVQTTSSVQITGSADEQIDEGQIQKQVKQQQTITQSKADQSSSDVQYSSPKKKVKKFDLSSTKQLDTKLAELNEQSSIQQQNRAKESLPIQQQQQSDSIIYPKNMQKTNKKSKEKLKHSTEQQPQDTKPKYSLTLFFTFCLYSLIIVLVVVTIKCTNSSSKAVKAVAIMVNAVGDIFKKRQGYRPTLNEQEVTEREQQITVGYNIEDNNKQIFWEKNSVQGI